MFINFYLEKSKLMWIISETISISIYPPFPRNLNPSNPKICTRGLIICNTKNTPQNTMNFKYLHTIYFIYLRAIVRIEYVNLSNNAKHKGHLEKDDDE